MAIKDIDPARAAFERALSFLRAGDGVMASRGTETDLFIGGRYVDRLERRDGVWKIARRVGIHDWQRYEAANDDGFFSTEPRKRGVRSRADLAYRRQ
jgi:hypothetical protein